MKQVYCNPCNSDKMFDLFSLERIARLIQFQKPGNAPLGIIFLILWSSWHSYS